MIEKRIIINEDQRVLVKEKWIKESDGKVILIKFQWKWYNEDRNCRFVRRNKKTEIENTLRRMKMGKVMGPNEIRIRSAWVMWVYAS